MGNYIGVDVGTGSARAGVFDSQGRCLGTAQKEISIFRPVTDFCQQSSVDIWAAIVFSVRQAVNKADIDVSSILGIGFDATCSLVVTDSQDKPVSVSPDRNPDQDIILWMDHRAINEAEEINRTGADVLRYVGGIISPEMEIPKLLWLKRNLPEAWSQAACFWDLPDWLVHRATGVDDRSLCSPVCKWTYRGQLGNAGEGWDSDFLAQIGLESLSHDNYKAIGNCFLGPGALAGYLSIPAGEELGLPAGIAVASGMIDAYAGALGTLGVNGEASDGRLAVIAGTSTCHISISQEPCYVPGVWGPYYSVLLPGLWANEGGQSAAGALIDAVIDRHAAASDLRAEAHRSGRSIYQLLEDVLSELGDETSILSRNRHVQPDFHGNRSPLAEPWRHGAVDGLSLDVSRADLALDYLATLQALAYGTRHIIDEMRQAGIPINTLVVSGGLARNRLFLREHADATGCAVVVPQTTEPVLLGSAMLGAVAAGEYDSLAKAMVGMSGSGEVLNPRGGKVSDYHQAKYKVMRRMQQDHSAYVALMKEAAQ